MSRTAIDQLSHTELERLHEQLRGEIVRKIETRVQELDSRLAKVRRLRSVQRPETNFQTAVSDMDVGQFATTFPNERACKAYLKERRWPDGVVDCPKCGSTRVRATSTPFIWICQACNEHGHRFSVRAGTVFGHSHLPLRDWFRGLHILETHPHADVREVRKAMPLYNSATVDSLCRRLRYALEHSPDRLGGVVALKRLRHGRPV